MSGIDLVDYVANFRRRVLQDALAEATSQYWDQRAAAFDSAMPTPGDFTGQATPAEIEDQRQRLADTAQACRWRALVALDRVESRER